MKKELTTQSLFLVGYFALVILIRRWFELSAIEFFLGGIIGVILPYADHFVHAYLMRPQETISLEVVQQMAQKKYKEAFKLLITTRRQQQKLIFHTAYFQLIFLALSFLVITSSGSFFGRGLVLGFALHILIDQVIDLKEIGNLDIWFRQFPLILDKEQKNWYIIGNVVMLLIFGLFF